MAERDFDEVRYAVGFPVEQEITSDGANITWAVAASDEEMGQNWVDSAKEELGGKWTRLNEQGPKSNFFGFSSSRWNAPWQPEGPKKNWMIPPVDPRLN